MSFRRKIKLAALYATSLMQKNRNAEFFREITTYCIFIGYPRTGHSLIGSLLDAHPRMIIAHEMDALIFLQHGFSRNQIFHLLLENSKKIAAAGRRHSGYSYEVPNQWQGRFEKLQILGDKKGARTAMGFYREPGLLDILRSKIDAELKFVHVMRNPYDVRFSHRLLLRRRVCRIAEPGAPRCSANLGLSKQLPHCSEALAE